MLPHKCVYSVFNSVLYEMFRGYMKSDIMVNKCN
jgi:hypothetical protein